MFSDDYFIGLPTLHKKQILFKLKPEIETFTTQLTHMTLQVMFTIL